MSFFVGVRHQQNAMGDVFTTCCGRTRADAMGDVALSLFYVTICCVVIDVQLLHCWDWELGCCSLDWD